MKSLIRGHQCPLNRLRMHEGCRTIVESGPSRSPDMNVCAEYVVFVAGTWVPHLQRPGASIRAGPLQHQHRADLEELTDHRVIGVDALMGKQRPDRRRIGTMLCRGVSCSQFWMVRRAMDPDPFRRRPVGGERFPACRARRRRP